MLKYFIFIFLLLPTTLLANELPSSVGVYQSFDNDQNRSSAIDISIATKPKAILKFGASSSHYQFDDINSGKNQSFYASIGSNPLRNWVWSGLFQYTKVSDQMDIMNPSISMQKYFSNWDIELEVGYRQIYTIVTPGLAQFIGNNNVNEDKNFWWNLRLNFDLSNSWSMGLNYLQYQYSTKFGFFNYPIAETLGYTLDTINYGASFADYIYSINLSYRYTDWFFSLDYNFAKNAFDETTTKSLTPRAGYQWNDHWAFDISLSRVQGFTQEQNTTSGQVLGLGLTYIW